MAYLPETSMIPPMPHVSEFDREELKTVKLKHVTGLVSREKKVPIFNAKSGIEGLLYCEEATREAFKYLQVTTGPDMFNLYSETLTGSAVRKWNNVVSNIDVANRTVAEFNRSMKRYYEHFVDDKSRDTMYEYLKTRDCGKPFKSSIYDHVDRLEELYRYSAQLPGTVPALDINVDADAQQIKQKIYSTFPERWRFEFENVHEVADTSQAEINKFMNRQRVKDNKQHAKKKGKEQKKNASNNEVNKVMAKAKRERGKRKGQGQRGRNDNGKKPKQLKGNDPCPIHGGHKWDQCFDNKHGSNYQPPRQHQNGGRGERTSERRDSHYSNAYYHNDSDRRYRSPSPARGAPSSPLTWDESHHFDNRSRYRGSASSAGSRYRLKSRSSRG